MRRLLAAALIMLAVTSTAEARGHHGLPWCGIYLSQYFHKTDRRLWLAREWATEGKPAPGPEVGVVVVWRHHVGVIVGKTDAGQWIIHSGNDGNAVRTRPRSVAGAIAFRYV